MQAGLPRGQMLRDAGAQGGWNRQQFGVADDASGERLQKPVDAEPFRYLSNAPFEVIGPEDYEGAVRASVLNEFAIASDE